MNENFDRKFQKRIESFSCEKCGSRVDGNGYTDHCPDCLWSKHVDINPGDRKSKCKGMMEPVGIEVKGGQNILHHKCVECGYRHRVKTDVVDNLDEIIKLSIRPIEK